MDPLKGWARGLLIGLLIAGLASCTNETSDDGPTVPAQAPTTASADPTTAPGPADSRSGVTPGPTTTNGLAPAPTVDTPTLAPVKPSETATTDNGVSISLKSWTPVTIPAGAPGEIGGPGVGIRIRVANRSSAEIDLNNVVVDLRYGKDEIPALRSERGSTAPFSGDLAPGENAMGTYAFRLDEADRARVRMLVRLSGEAPVVVFKGSLLG